MKEMVMMTREEYKAFYESFQNLKMKCDLMDVDLSHAQDTINRLWNELNRPAIEALQAKHDAEFYDWCEEMAEKYEKLDEEEWITDRAKWYNNGLCIYAKTHGCKNTAEVYEDQKYNRCYNVSFENWEDEPTEGWSNLPYYRTCSSSILAYAMDDVWDRYEKNKTITGHGRGPYWHLWETFENMEDESQCLGNSYHEFYR